MTVEHVGPAWGEPCDDSLDSSPVRETQSTPGLIVDLALVEDRLRSLARRRTQAGPTPHGTAQQDQMQAYERDILTTLHRRRLSFRALAVDGGATLGEASVAW